MGNLRWSVTCSAVLVSTLVWMRPARADTIDAASCSQADVQSAIDAAANGDTVSVPAGTCSWSALSIPSSKGMTLAGAGGDATTIDGVGAVSVSSNATTSTRVTGFSFTGIGTSNDGDVAAFGSIASAPYRIDHNAFTNNGQSVFITVGGNGPGLIDHNTFTGGGASEIIHNVGMGPTDDSGWTDDVTPGGPEMVFIEDNVFNNTDTTYIYSAVQSYYGARTVFRYNVLSFAQVDQHGTAGMIGARWFEIYENTFQPNGLNQCCYGGIRAGSGLVFDNHVVGAPQWGPAGFDFYEEDTGAWPLAYQVGSGINGHTDQHSTCTLAKNSSPVYLWGNDPNIEIGSQTAAKVVEGRDYIVSATKPATLSVQQKSSDTCASTISYEPYTYPHPLAGGVSVDGGGAGGGSGGGSPDASGTGAGAGTSAGGGGGTVGDGSAGSAGKASSSSDGGCGCRTGSGSPISVAAFAGGLLAALALGRRRRVGRKAEPS